MNRKGGDGTPDFENFTLANLTVEVFGLKEGLNDVFLLSNGIIVCLMQCGFACLEAGAVRSKNTTNIIMKNIMDIFISAVAYWLVGYALGHGHGNPVFGGTYFAGVGLPAGRRAHWFFHCVFAATAATLVSGAVAERCNYIAYITYSAVISGLIYPPATHWVWTEEGWLQKLGYQDYSGCGPVHLLGGVCSFWGAFLLGPRIGRFEKKRNNKQSETIMGHSVPLTGIGGMILVAGFLAFNGAALGSMANPDDEDTISRVIINTVLGGSGGSIVMLAVCKLGLFGPPAWSFSLTLNAAFIGMVSVCASPDKLDMWAGFVSGASTVPIYLLIHHFMIWNKVDDPLDAVAVHFGGGFWGLITGSFLAEDGIFYGATYDSAMVLLLRMLGALVIICWATCTSCIMFLTLKFFGKLRVNQEQELRGLDISMHNEPGYPPEGWLPLQPLPLRNESEALMNHKNIMNSESYFSERL
ncbi:putative ammonium transporter 1 isoform X3 [Periplaneta americana]|uniref:putative ammonium transporter 1 isoform X3 n=1 Tax=Periplaneta americana TaxID=6978 RepID=UPI0037E8E454